MENNKSPSERANEIYHHGTKGQKWGVRRYQNEDGSLTPAGRLRYLQNGGDERDLDGDESFEERKERIMKTGTAKEVMAFRGLASNQEIQEAVNRINLEKQIAKLSQEEKDANWQKADAIMQKVGQVTNWVGTGISAYNKIAAVYNTFNENPLPVINGKFQGNKTTTQNQDSNSSKKVSKTAKSDDQTDDTGASKTSEKSVDSVKEPSSSTISTTKKTGGSGGPSQANDFFSKGLNGTSKSSGDTRSMDIDPLTSSTSSTGPFSKTSGLNLSKGSSTKSSDSSFGSKDDIAWIPTSGGAGFPALLSSGKSAAASLPSSTTSASILSLPAPTVSSGKSYVDAIMLSGDDWEDLLD